MSQQALIEPRVERRPDPVSIVVLQDSFPSRGLFIPRNEGRANRRRTSSFAASRRAGLVYDERPMAAAATVLSRHGHQPAGSDLSTLEQAPGMFEELNMLGVTAAAFRDADEADKIARELADDYEYVADFALRLPDPQLRATARVAGAAAVAKLAEAEWPEESGIPRARKDGNDGRGVLIGTLDTGVDAGHQEFANKTIHFRYVGNYPKSTHWPCRDVFGFDTDHHGTHVSGIIAGKTRGIVPGAKFYMASVIESESTLTTLTRIIEGLDWLLKSFASVENQDVPAVVNLSLALPSAAPGDIRPAEYETRIRSMRYVIEALLAANVLTVAAIGNNGEDTFGYPGAFSETLGVGAVNFSRQVASFSGNRRFIDGPIEAEKPDLVGFGVEVFSSIERDCDGQSYYGPANGTSMAAPYVTGIAALYRAALPDVPAAEIRQMVLEKCLPIDGQPAHRIGAGLARYMEE